MLTFYRVNEEVPAVDVARAITDGESIDMESCTISGPLAVFGIDAEGPISIRDTEFSEPASFLRVNFNGPSIEFYNCKFIGGVTFNESTFSEQEGTVSFEESRFREKASFQATRFNRSVSFRKSNFRENAIFANVVFAREADFRESVFREEADFSSANFNRSADFRESVFGKEADFSSASFNRSADFRESVFGKEADFSSANFNRSMDFRSATFAERVDFRSATFVEQVDFAQAYLRLPANFAGVEFQEDTARKWLWRYILRHVFQYPVFLLLCLVSLVPEMWKRMRRVRGTPTVQLARSNWEKIRSWKAVTHFYMNTVTVMDGSSNPYLKRYIEDEQWIESWRSNSRLRKLLFYVWGITSHCGRSFGLWLFWSVFVAVVFALIYQAFGGDSIVFSMGKCKQPDLKAYLYYSVVTFTTLGFGDIIPKTNWARLAVAAEVVLGYVMLGGLISIFASKFARRS